MHLREHGQHKPMLPPGEAELFKHITIPSVASGTVESDRLCAYQYQPVQRQRSAKLEMSAS